MVPSLPPRIGQEFVEKGVTFRIVDAESIPYPSGKPNYRVKYRLICGKYVGPKGNIWVDSNEKFRKEISEAVDDYLEISKTIMGATIRLPKATEIPE